MLILFFINPFECFDIFKDPAVCAKLIFNEITKFHNVQKTLQ